MAQTNGEKLLAELNGFLPENDTFVPDQGSDAEELPFESLDDFSTDPISFEEVTAMINNKVEHFFELSAKYNRHSSKYLEVCSFLERGIKYLSGCCLTKTRRSSPTNKGKL